MTRFISILLFLCASLSFVGFSYAGSKTRGNGQIACHSFALSDQNTKLVARVLEDLKETGVFKADVNELYFKSIIKKAILERLEKWNPELIRDTGLVEFTLQLAERIRDLELKSNSQVSSRNRVSDEEKNARENQLVQETVEVDLNNFPWRAIRKKELQKDLKERIDSTKKSPLQDKRYYFNFIRKLSILTNEHLSSIHKDSLVASYILKGIAFSFVESSAQLFVWSHEKHGVFELKDIVSFQALARVSEKPKDKELESGLRFTYVNEKNLILSWNSSFLHLEKKQDYVYMPKLIARNALPSKEKRKVKEYAWPATITYLGKGEYGLYLDTTSVVNVKFKADYFRIKPKLED